MSTNSTGAVTFIGTTLKQANFASRNLNTVGIQILDTFQNRTFSVSVFQCLEYRTDMAPNRIDHFYIN
jgi:hypothetical protein